MDDPYNDSTNHVATSFLLGSGQVVFTASVGFRPLQVEWTRQVPRSALCSCSRIFSSFESVDNLTRQANQKKSKSQWVAKRWSFDLPRLRFTGAKSGVRAEVRALATRPGTGTRSKKGGIASVTWQDWHSAEPPGRTGRALKRLRLIFLGDLI